MLCVFICLLLPMAIISFSNKFSFQPRYTIVVDSRRKCLQFERTKTLYNELASTKDSESTSTPISKTSSGTATLKSSTVNLVKNCVGAGVFSLNSRVSTITTNPADLVYVGGLVGLMALWSAYNFYIVGETCKLTDSETLGEAWSKTVSPSTSWIIQSVVTIAPMVGCLANTIVLTDVLTLALRVAGLPSAVYLNRPFVIALLTGAILYPVCSVKDLSGLKSTSVLGLTGQFAAMCALGKRLWDRSYALPAGKYVAAVAATAASTSRKTATVVAAAATNSLGSSPAATAVKGMSLSTVLANPKPWFVLASLLSYCYVTHYNAPRYFKELSGKEQDRFSFLKLSLFAYSAAAVVYFSTIVLAYLLFGSGSSSFALNSFSPKDPLAVISLLAFGTSVLASFPLMFLSMRNWFISKAVKIKLFNPVSNIPNMTALLLSCIGLLATQIRDIGKVGSLSGALFGSAMMFVFPPIMYMRAIWKTKDTHSNPLGLRVILIANTVLLASGLSLGLLGTWNTILSLMGKKI